MKRIKGLVLIFMLSAFLFSACKEPESSETFNPVVPSSRASSSEQESSSANESSEATSSSASSSSETSSADNSSEESSSSVSSDKSEEVLNVSSVTQSISQPETEPPPKSDDVQKECYLTFDDGPSDNTLKILEILEKSNVKATFFVIGNNPEYLKDISEGGHAIGLHSYSHRYSIYKSSDAFFSDLNKLSDSIYDQIGVRPQIMRFAGGSSNLISRKHSYGIMSKLTKEVKEKGYSYYDWNVDSGDASGKNVPAETIVNNVLNGAKNKTSICVLMHDTAEKGTTVEALPKIIEELRKQGFEFKVLTPDIKGFKHTVNN